MTRAILLAGVLLLLFLAMGTGSPPSPPAPGNTTLALLDDVL